MPYERLQSLFATMFNVTISHGTLANIVREMLDKSQPAIALIERLSGSLSLSASMSRDVIVMANSIGRG